MFCPYPETGSRVFEPIHKGKPPIQNGGVVFLETEKRYASPVDGSSSMIYPAAVSIGFAVTLFSLPVQAQMYPQDIHAHSRQIGPSAPTQSFFARGGAYGTASELLQRREEEERERREIRERQRRMLENFTNIPDQLRQFDMGRIDTPFTRR